MADAMRGDPGRRRPASGGTPSPVASVRACVARTVASMRSVQGHRAPALSDQKSSSATCARTERPQDDARDRSALSESLKGLKHPGRRALRECGVRGRTTAAALVRRSLGGQEFDAKDNSLNLLRLVLAALVIVAHSFITGGFGDGPQIKGLNLGGWAVYGFFVASGYLIAGSRLSGGLGRYLVLRVARIYPGFLANLALTAGVIAPIVYWHAHGSVRGYLGADTTPLRYVVGNITLLMVNYDIAGTPGGVPYPLAWNGSLWSLAFEFACYLIVGFSLCVVVFRRHMRAFSVAAFGVSCLVAAQAPGVLVTAGAPAVLASFASQLAQLVPFFVAGVLLYSFRDVVRYCLLGAIISATAASALILFVPEMGPQMSAPLLAYVIFFLASVLPCPGVIKREDVSYGVYIYGFIVEQILALCHVHGYGYLIYMLASLCLTVPLAVGSWRFIEKPAMRFARNAVISRSVSTSPDAANARK